MPSALSSYGTPSSKMPSFVGQNNLSQYGLRDEPVSTENVTLQDALATFVKGQFDRAADHRRAIGIDDRLTRNLYAYKCEYSPEQQQLLDPDANVYVGLCALKARALQSWLRDIILNNIEKPWTMETTPIPDLPESAKEQVLDLLEMELADLTDISQIRERARELKTVALDQAKELAERANSKMETLLTDQFYQNAFPSVFTGLIEDISVYPAAFVRGPFNVRKKVAAWRGNTYSAEEQDYPECRLINPFDAYPAPNATNANDGEFFIERAKLSPDKLYEKIGVKGFDEVNIRRALNDYCEGYSLDIPSDTTRDALEEKDQDTVEKGGHIDTLIYNGLVSGKLLIEHKVLVADPQKYYEAEIWVCGEYVTRATLNPDPTGSRLIYSTSAIKATRSPWGKSIIDVVYDTERICNASVRSLVKNMAFSSGPIAEAVSTRIEGDPRDMYPYKVFLVTPDVTGSGAPAIKFNKVDSVANELMAVFERFLKVADDLSGIPAYVLGNPQVAGAGRTMGGLSMLMGNAAKGVKNIQLNIDTDIITPLVRGFYVYNMQTSKDTSIKADARVVARGATGLLQRELSQARLVEILNVLAPFLPIWDQMPDGIKVLLREILKQTGLPVDNIIADPNAQNELMAKVRELSQAESFNRGTSNPVPLPPQSQPNVNPNPMPLALPGPA